MDSNTPEMPPATITTAHDGAWFSTKDETEFDCKHSRHDYWSEIAIANNGGGCSATNTLMCRGVSSQAGW